MASKCRRVRLSQVELPFWQMCRHPQECENMLREHALYEKMTIVLLTALLCAGSDAWQQRPLPSVTVLVWSQQKIPSCCSTLVHALACHLVLFYAFSEGLHCMGHAGWSAPGTLPGPCCS